MSKKANELKDKIIELQEALKELDDSNKIYEISLQIKKLEKQLPSTIWKKVIFGLGIISAVAGIAYTIMDMVLIFI